MELALLPLAPAQSRQAPAKHIQQVLHFGLGGRPGGGSRPTWVLQPPPRLEPPAQLGGHLPGAYRAPQALSRAAQESPCRPPPRPRQACRSLPPASPRQPDATASTCRRRRPQLAALPSAQGALPKPGPPRAEAPQDRPQEGRRAVEHRHQSRLASSRDSQPGRLVGLERGVHEDLKPTLPASAAAATKKSMRRPPTLQVPIPPSSAARGSRRPRPSAATRP